MATVLETLPETLSTQGATQQPLSISAQIKRRSNGDNSKSAPVQVVAYTGDIVFFEDIGAVVFDLETMSHKDRIPLDWAHDFSNSIGYINHFDALSGALVCTGAIVPFENDMGAEVIAKMAEGVPYEASIEAWSYTLEYVLEGLAVTVNGKTFEGPLSVVRNWTLKAMAVCKFGRDENTSVMLASENSENQSKSLKGKAIYLSKYKDMTMSETNKSETVDVAAPVEKAEVVTEVKENETAKVEATAVETAAKETVTQETPAVETAVEKTEVVTEVVTASAEMVDVEKQLEATATVTVDPRAEAKRFLATFGDVSGAKYFADGLSYDDALTAHVKAQSEQIIELNKRLASVDRGASKPVAFSDTEKQIKASPIEAMKSFIKRGDKKAK